VEGDRPGDRGYRDVSEKERAYGESRRQPSGAHYGRRHDPPLLCIAHLLSRVHAIPLFFSISNLVYSCLALGDLLDHIQPVVLALERAM